MSSPSTIQCSHKYIISCAFAYLNPMPRPLQHHINAPSVPLPQFGAASSHMGQQSPPPNPDSNFLAGPKIFLVYCADEIHRTFSCERSRSLAQRESLCVFFTLILLSPLSLFAQRNYHAKKRKMPVASSYQLSNTHISAVAGTPETMGAPRPHNTDAIWRARFVRWLCCAPI
jgi:hypothetical protein